MLSKKTRFSLASFIVLFACALCLVPTPAEAQDPELTWATKPGEIVGTKLAVMSYALTVPTGPDSAEITYDSQTTPPLPRGLSIIKVRGRATVYGIPEVGSARQTYTVTARYKDQSATQTFDLVVHSSPEFPETLNLNQSYGLPEKVFQMGEAISFVLPSATDEDGDAVTYTLTRWGKQGVEEGLPPGLSFDASTRTVSGTLTTAESYLLAYTAVDGGSHASDTDTQIFQAIITFAWATKPGEIVGTKDTVISSDLPIPTGPSQDEITYDSQTTPSLPRGLSIIKVRGGATVYGIPEAGSARQTYTVTARYKDLSVTQTFDLVVHSSPEFPTTLNFDLPRELPEKVFQIGEAISFVLPSATDEDGDAVTYTLAIWGGTGLPTGLSFDASTRTVSGTITTAGSYYLVYTAVDGGSHESDIDAQIFQKITIEPDRTLRWATKPSEIVGTKLAVMSYALTVPTGPDSAEITYDSQTTPSLPRGLSIRKVGTYPTVYGIAEVGSARQTYTVTARYKDESATQTFDLVVHSSPEFPTTLNLNQSDGLPEKVFRTDEAISFVLPSATDEDGDAVTYTLAIWGGAGLPTGLSFDASTRTVSGTITTAGSHLLAYTAVDGGSHASDRDAQIFQKITIAEVGVVDDDGDGPSERTPIGKQPGPIGLNDDGDDDDEDDGDGPSERTPIGLNDDGDDDDDGDDGDDGDGPSERTPIGLEPVPTLTWATKPADAIGNSAGTKLTVMSHALTVPTGPNKKVITYDSQTTPSLPRGLSIRKVGTYAIVYGIPEVGSARRTYTVTARYKDQSATQTFDLVVHSSPEFPTTLNLSRSQELPGKVFQTGEAISFVLPSATDEDGDAVTYTLAIWRGNGLPTGLSFDASTRTVSGTLTTAGEHLLAYTAVDGGSHASDTDTQILQRVTLTVEPVDPTPIAGEDPTLTWATKPADAIGSSAGAKESLLSHLLTVPTGPAFEEITYDSQTTPSLPRGLSIRKVAGYPTVHGIPEVGSARQTYTATARYKDQSATQTFDLVVHSSPEFPTTLNLDRSRELPKKMFQTGEALSFVLPSATDEDGDAVTYTLAIWEGDGLPTGLSFDASTRTVSGTLTTAGEHRFVYTAVDGGSHESDTDTQIFQTITTFAWATKPSDIVGTKLLVMYHTLTVPTGPAFEEITYDSQTTPSLPRGLSIRKVVGYPTVYGIPEVGSAGKTYTVTARYKDQSATQTFDLVVHSSPEFPTTLNLDRSRELPKKVFQTGEAISFVLPSATDEDGDAVTYTLGIGEQLLTYTASDTSVSSTGLSFDASTRTVSGTITTAGEYLLTYTAVDGGSHASDIDTQIYQRITIVTAVFRVIGGTAEDYTDAQGRLWRGAQKHKQTWGGWVEKQPLTQGVAGKLKAKAQAKAAAAGYDAQLFQAVSWAKHPDTLAYQFNTGNGTFDVTCLFGEHWSNTRGFAILIEDTVVETLYVTPGRHEIDIKTYRGIEVSDGKLNIQLKGNSKSGVKNVNPMFSALEVVSAVSVVEPITELEEPAAPLSVVPDRLTLAKVDPFLAVRIPEETALLANYPNPFNPETWIPYQLAKPAEVTVHIYGINGDLVRTLALGHRAAGMYDGRSRAVHWDGKNAVGEPVASGVYFYTLTAGDFSATRKLLIQK